MQKSKYDGKKRVLLFFKFEEKNFKDLKTKILQQCCLNLYSSTALTSCVFCEGREGVKW